VTLSQRFRNALVALSLFLQHVRCAFAVLSQCCRNVSASRYIAFVLLSQRFCIAFTPLHIALFQCFRSAFAELSHHIFVAFVFTFASLSRRFCNACTSLSHAFASLSRRYYIAFTSFLHRYHITL
jgi:hypothetical protein